MSNNKRQKQSKGKEVKKMSQEELFNSYPKIGGTSKMGDIPTVNMPRLITCRCNAPCAKSCYAGRHYMNYDNVKLGHIRNLEVFNSNSKLYFEKIWFYLERSTTQYFRWHACGDIPTEEYLNYMCKTARKFPKVNFLAFTKKYELCDSYFMTKKKPRNLSIVYSCWFELIPENPHNFPLNFIKGKTQKCEEVFHGLEFAERQINYCKYNTGNGGCPACIDKEKTNCWKLKKGECMIMNKH